MTWSDFVRWLQGKTPTEEHDHVGASVTMHFACGCVATARSEFDGPHSPDTPGLGSEPPTVDVVSCLEHAPDDCARCHELGLYGWHRADCPERS